MDDNPVMFLCEKIPGGIQLTEASCAKQWFLAQKEKEDFSAIIHDFKEKIPSSSCQKCKKGEERYKLFPPTFREGNQKRAPRHDLTADTGKRSLFKLSDEIDMKRTSKTKLNKEGEFPEQNSKYKELMKTILCLSIKHYLTPSSKSDFLSQQKWIFKKNKDEAWLFSFQFICEELGFDYDSLKKRLKIVKANQGSSPFSFLEEED